MELLTATTPIPWWEIIGTKLCWAVSLIFWWYNQHKYRKAKMHYASLQERYALACDRHVQEIDKLQVDYDIAVDKAIHSKNEFYEDRIKHLNEKLARATDENRLMALHYAAKLGGSTSDVTKAASQFYRHLQGKLASADVEEKG